jgi:hypothetical protein
VLIKMGVKQVNRIILEGESTAVISPNKGIEEAMIEKELV